MKNKLKGFTLIELIIVMAIFSILMLGAMSLVGPVSRIHRHTNDFEKSYSYVDTIQNYIQDSLSYADNVWVYQGDIESDLSADTLDFMQAYYKDIVVNNSVSGSGVKNANCIVRVMTILNKDTTIDGQNYPKGQILMREVTYSSDETVAKSLSTAQAQMNPVFFTDKFAFDYILGVSRMVKNGDGLSVENMDSSGYSAIDDYITYAKDLFRNPKDLAIGVVTYDARQNSDGSYKYTNNSDVLAVPATRIWRKYDSASIYSAINIPLLNIIERKNNVNTSYFTRGTLANGSTGIISATPAAASPYMIKDISMSADDNIYIIYTLCDEAAVYPQSATP